MEGMYVFSRHPGPDSAGHSWRTPSVNRYRKGEATITMQYMHDLKLFDPHWWKWKRERYVFHAIYIKDECGAACVKVLLFQKGSDEYYLVPEDHPKAEMMSQWGWKFLLAVFKVPRQGF